MVGGGQRDVGRPQGARPLEQVIVRLEQPRAPDVLQLRSARRLGDVAVLLVAEAGKGALQAGALARETDEVDVRELTVHEREVRGVAAYGEPAGQAQAGAVAAGGLDDGQGLRREAVGAAGLRGVDVFL